MQPNQMLMEQLQGGVSCRSNRSRFRCINHNSISPAGDNKTSKGQQEAGMALFGGLSGRAGGLWSEHL